MRRSLLRILAVAHEQRLDTEKLVANLADEHRGANRRLLLRLARRLKSGMPLVTALEQTPDVLSDHQVLAIRFGSQTGTLQAALQNLIRESALNRSTANRDMWNATFYLGAMTLVLICVTSFLVLFIEPVFRKITAEFEIGDPPWPYSFVAWTFRHAGSITFLLPLFLLAAGFFLWLSPTGAKLYRRVADSRLQWVQKLRVAELLELLAQSVASGRPLSSALSTLARYHFDKHVRLRLLYVRNEVEQGASVWDSFHDSNLLSREEANALAASSSPASQAWLMRRLAHRKRQQAMEFAEVSAHLFQLFAVLIVAAAVLLLGGAAYQYLAHLVYTVN